jgi:hypothetical protein
MEPKTILQSFFSDSDILNRVFTENISIEMTVADRPLEFDKNMWIPPASSLLRDFRWVVKNQYGLRVRKSYGSYQRTDLSKRNFSN